MVEYSKKYRIIFFCVLAIFVFTTSYVFFSGGDPGVLEKEGMEIPYDVYERSAEVMSEENPFFICSFEEQECLPFLKIPQ